MTFGAIFLLSVGLAMDATAVAAARGCSARRLELRHVLSISLLFGGFQALMPCLGWLVGARVGPLIQVWDHWIAFGLLSAIGGKMLWEARSGHGAAAEPAAVVDEAFRFQVLILLAIATSIDALAVGVTLPMLNAPFAGSLVTIGITTAVLSAMGVLAGRRFGSALGRRLDAFGGLVLVALGSKILIEHLSAA